MFGHMSGLYKHILDIGVQMELMVEDDPTHWACQVPRAVRLKWTQLQPISHGNH